MGYDVHITRADGWTDAEAAAITLDEWLALLRGDPEMRLEGFAELTTPDATLRYESQGLALWTPPGYEADGKKVWFDYRRGCIVVKNPDEAVLEKMMQIALKLNAKVIGDDGEEY